MSPATAHLRLVFSLLLDCSAPAAAPLSSFGFHIFSHLSPSRQCFSVPGIEAYGRILGAMARLNTMSAAAAVCFLAFVCVQVAAQPMYAPEMAPIGAPVMPPVDSPMYAPELAPAPSPAETPMMAPMSPPPVAAGPGPGVDSESSASSIVPSAAFAVLSVAAFFLH